MFHWKVGMFDFNPFYESQKDRLDNETEEFPSLPASECVAQ